MPEHGSQPPSAGPAEIVVFLLALCAGTACSLTSKMLLSMQSVGLTGEVEAFSFPLFQTFGMFVGMLASLPIHWMVVWFKIPFYGYAHLREETGEYVSITGEASKTPPKEAPMNVILLLIFPAVCDLVATALAMFGLQHVSVSMYQILRGSCIVFTALANKFILQKNVRSFQWVGIFWNVASIGLIGITARLTSQSKTSDELAAMTESEKNPLLGIFYILCGAVVQSFQYVFEERAMSDAVNVSPLVLTGMEGLWGTVICACVLYPLAYYLPGPDHGCIENPYNTWTLISNSKEIQSVFILYFVSVFAYNILALLVTKMMDSVWHAILDNFRPITVWGTDLFIFYFLTTSFGEALSPYSWLQLLAVFVLIYGTLIYNAPNPGSLELTGGIESCFMDFSDEYDEVRESDDAGPHQGAAPSPFFHTMTPIQSPSLGKKPSAEQAKYGAVSAVEMAARRKTERSGSFA